MIGHPDAGVGAYGSTVVDVTSEPSWPQSLPSPAQLRSITVDAAQQAGLALKEVFRSHMVVDTKSSPQDLVTVWDQRTEETLIAALTRAVPDSRITGEEGGSHGTGRLEWIIDPIDGTSNFAHGFAMFSISIAAAVDDEVIAGVVHDPINQLTFSADDDAAWLSVGTTGERRLQPQAKAGQAEEQLNLVTSYPSAEVIALRGEESLHAFGELVSTYATVRRVVSGALELCHAAAGWADVAAGVGTNPWDVAAAQLILRRAGGRYLAFGARTDRSWSGEAEPAGRHLAPDYVGLAPGVIAPTIGRIIAAHRRSSKV